MAKRLDSRAKGASGERQAAAAIAKAFGVNARRGQQFSGSPDSPDIVSDLPIHWECKRVERGNPYVWLDQACRDAGDKVPVVIHRRNNHEWILVMRLADGRAFAEALQTDAPLAAEDVPVPAEGKGKARRRRRSEGPSGRMVLARRNGGGYSAEA